jgi:hypothetical protein
MTHVDSIHSSSSQEWFTPAIYVEAVRRVLGVLISIQQVAKKRRQQSRQIDI